MKLPRTGREYYVQKLDPADTQWEATFDNGATWVAGAVDPTDLSRHRWLVQGPDFDGPDAGATTVPRDTTPSLRTVDAPEVLVRQGARITLVQYGGPTEPLLGPGDLVGLPGSPFTTEVVAAVSDQIRSLCGWHIAPSRTETLILDSDGDRTLLLPSLYVAEVTAVRDVSRSTPRVIDSWTWSRDGFLTRGHGGYWPEGLRVLEVDLTHGYDSCPVELFAVAADFGRRRVAAESIGGRSVTYVGGAEDDRLSSTLSAYKLGARP